MRVEALVPDTPPESAQRPPDTQLFGKALQQIGDVLTHAESAEDAFAAGRGQLGTAIYERARADVVLSIATAAAQRSAQALQSILNMQV